MKNRVVLIVVLCLLLTACGQIDFQHTTDPEYPTTTQPDTRPTSLVTYFSTRSYDEYQAFMNKFKVSDEIVTYEELSHLGTFRKAYFSDSPEVAVGLSYNYSVETKTGYQLSIVFHPIDSVFAQNHLEPEYEDFSIHSENNLLAVSKKEGSGYVRRNDVVYKYLFGELVSATWIHGEHVVYLSSANNWCFDFENIEDEPLFIQQLVCADTIETAMQTFKASMDAPAVK